MRPLRMGRTTPCVEPMFRCGAGNANDDSRLRLESFDTEASPPRLSALSQSSAFQSG